MADSNVTSNADSGKSEDKNQGSELPWLDGNTVPTAKMIEDIVHYFPTYAINGQGKLHSGNEDEKRNARTFLKCLEGGIIRGYFKDEAREIKTEEARNIAADALELADEFGGWFHPGGGVTEQDLKSYPNLSWRWKKVVRRFNMCMSSKDQQKEQVERLDELNDMDKKIVLLYQEAEKEAAKHPKGKIILPGSRKIASALYKAGITEKEYSHEGIQKRIRNLRKQGLIGHPDDNKGRAKRCTPEQIDDMEGDGTLKRKF